MRRETMGLMVIVIIILIVGGVYITVYRLKIIQLAVTSFGSPLIYGWGGILATGAVHITSGSPLSQVFSGEIASNTEVTFKEMVNRHYNGARVAIIDPGNRPDSGTYNSNAWHRTLQLAKYYNLWVIGDDHEYDCPTTTFWGPVFLDTPMTTYPNVIWEPKNEPHCTTLAQSDQVVIDLARSIGDTRWFVLGCNNDCSGSSPAGSMPIVTDPLNHIFYNFHEYYFWTSHSATWSIADAINWADQQVAGAQQVQNVLGRPFLGTEFGAELDCYACSPDQRVVGSAGYSPETLAYVSEIATKFHALGIGYTWWNAGDWNDAPAGITGALDTFGSCPPLNGPTLPCLPTPSVPNPPPPSVLTTSFNFAPNNAVPNTIITFSASASGGTAPYDYRWNFGNTLLSGQTVTFSYNAPANYTVGLTTRDSSFPQQVASFSDEVNVIPVPPSPVLSATFTFTPLNPKVGDSVYFSPTVTGGTTPYNYNWTFTGIGSSNLKNPTATWFIPGNFTVTLIVTDLVNAKVTTTNTITVVSVQNPPPPNGGCNYCFSVPFIISVVGVATVGLSTLFIIARRK